MRNRVRAGKLATLDRLLKVALPLSVVALTSACTGAVDGDPPSGEDATQSQPLQPTPVASLALEGGHVVEFYDFERTALISETGRAGTVPLFNPPNGPVPPDKLVDVWKSLAPEKAVPESLIALQTKLVNLPEPSVGHLNDNTRIGRDNRTEPAAPANLGEGLLAAPSGCNNGCCDYDWLFTFNECHNQGNYDYSWFLYNNGWSGVSTSDDARGYNGMACSAIGTSTYSVNMQGPGGTWAVAQATFRRFNWVATSSIIWGWDERAITSSVNSPTGMHTYCGQVNWD